ncbi:hypothetical protein LguiB_010071 [Lonicera macranthoides]
MTVHHAMFCISRGSLSAPTPPATIESRSKTLAPTLSHRRLLSPNFPSQPSTTSLLSSIDNFSSLQHRRLLSSIDDFSQIDQGVKEDPRIKVLKEWFEGKDCLDIGCDSGLITITIASPPSLHSTSLFFFFISIAIAIAIAIVASPHPDRGTLPWELALGIVKLWMSITASGEKVSFLDPECRLELNEDFGELGFSENELVPINVSFIGKCHVVVEENPSFGQFNSPEGKKSGMRRISSGGNMRGEEYGDVDDVIVPESGSSGSLPDRLMSDLYQYFANRTSPSGDRASRRQRRREKERQGRRKWEPEHFVKIVN